MDTGKLIDSMKRVVKSELGSYDTTATVKRVEGNTAWVHIPGGVDETPVRLTMNAKEGDNVQVRVSDGKAFLAGNVSAPPTDDTTAEAAKALANRAAEDAGRAKTAADIAESYATSAQASAAQSANILEGMEQAAIAAGTTLDGIYADAAEAKATTDEINDYADTAGKTVTQILNDGETAGAAASAAQQAADTALVNLATTEDVVGVLNWITAHGTMVSQYGEVFDPDKVYFIVDPTGDYVVSGTHYSVVPSPVAEDIDSYYILNISESVQNYVATHIVVDTEGLWIIPDAGGNKVLIATGSGSTYTTAGTYIVGKVNGVDAVFAKFTADGATMQRGSTDIAHLGYGPGRSSGGSTINAPYYTLGYRASGSVVGNYSVAEGWATIASGYSSHAEGNSSEATGHYSHAEGNETEASGQSSHAEGSGGTIASGISSHAEGFSTTASGNYSHSEGIYAEANGSYSHAQNYSTIAQRRSQTAIGEFNIIDDYGGIDKTTHGKYAFIVGNGTANSSRSNAATLDWSGNLVTAGDITDGSGNVLSAKANTSNLATVATSGNYTDLTNKPTIPTATSDLTNDSGFISEDANGDISITRNITAGGNVEAAGDVTDGAGNVLANKDTSAWAYMYISSKQLNNTETKITGLTLRGGGNYTDYFDISTANQIKIKKAGVYHVEIYMRFTSVTNAANVKRISVFKNGASNVGCLGRPNSYEDVTTWDLQTYAANDVLTMYGRSEDGNATVSYPRVFIKPLF